MFYTHIGTVFVILAICFSVVLSVNQTTEVFDRLPTYQENEYEFWTEKHRALWLEEVEVLFQYKETQEFLETFGDPEHRGLVRKQLYYCPYTSLCTFSFNLYLTDSIGKSTCDQCSCGPDCGVTTQETSNCCPDILNYTDWVLNRSGYTESGDCFWQFRPLKMPVQGYQLVQTCDVESGKVCNSSYQTYGGSFPETTPVTDLDTNISYINKDCALCNMVRAQSLVYWNTKLECVAGEQPFTPSLYFNVDGDVNDFIMTSRYCSIRYTPAVPGVTSCETNVIDSCNITGKWEKFDSFLQTACYFYAANYTPQPSNGINEGLLYRNVFCALCNGYAPTVVVWKRSRDHSDQVLTFPLPLVTSQALQEQECVDGLSFEKQGECLKLHCPPRRELRQGRCELVKRYARDIVYTYTLKLVPTARLKADNDTVSYIQDQFLDWFEGIAEIAKLMKPFPTPYSLDVCDVSVYHRQNQNCTHDSTYCPSTEFIIFDMKLQVNDWHYLDAVVQLSEEVKTNTFEIIQFIDKIQYDLLPFEIKEINFDKDNYTLVQSFSQSDKAIDDSCKVASEVIKLTQQKPCPTVLITLEQFDWYIDEFDLHITDLNLTLSPSDFHLVDNSTSVHICYNATLKHPSSAARKLQSPPFTGEQLLSVVCISVSLACLVFSLTVYIILGPLRTLPGKNNMALMSNLVLAQSFFLISSFGRLIQESVECVTIGILTHFFWLSSIFWMGICTFHVFRTLSSLTRSLPGDDRKRFLAYVSVSIVLASGFVLANILVSKFTSDSGGIGYGKETCYIDSPKMIGYTFALPVGLVIIQNATLFIICICRMRNIPDVQKNVKERNDLAIFMKLSTLTGFTWIFGFIFVWTDAQLFSYLFIILNASQGVFLCLSFICNGRVFGMLKTSFTSFTTSKSSLSKSELHNSQPHTN